MGSTPWLRDLWCILFKPTGGSVAFFLFLKITNQFTVPLRAQQLCTDPVSGVSQVTPHTSPIWSDSAEWSALTHSEREKQGHPPQIPGRQARAGIALLATLCSYTFSSQAASTKLTEICAHSYVGSGGNPDYSSSIFPPGWRRSSRRENRN